MAGPTGRILLELHADEDSLTGRATTSDGGTHEFTGWLGLLSTLQALVAGDQPLNDAAPQDRSSR